MSAEAGVLGYILSGERDASGTVDRIRDDAAIGADLGDAVCLSVDRAPCVALVAGKVPDVAGAAAELKKLGSSSALVCTLSSLAAAVGKYKSAGFQQFPERLDRSRDA